MKGLIKIDEMLDTSNAITSNKFNLKSLIALNKTVNIQIPLYQRLYVWELEEVKLFIEDISEAFLQKKNFYYIGNMMFGNKQDYHNIIIDLIDGQQRFTTLWLTSILLGKYSIDLKKFGFIDNKPRLSFISRLQVNDFFKNLQKMDIDLLDRNNPYFGNVDCTIEPLKNGLENIYNSLKEVIEKYHWIEKDLEAFSNYIFTQLLMVQTTVPLNNDLNQIFESLNSGGKQLENHQILKSRLFKVLKLSSTYSIEEINELVYKWDAASKMNIYIERAVYSVTSNNWEQTLNNKVWNSDFETNNSIDYFQLNKYTTSNVDPISLLDILEGNVDDPTVHDEGKKQAENVKSIISFSQFLLHTLRVYYLIKKIPE